ncbi:flagellar hook-basal body complex protein [Roseomonas sp. GC11]|uniref:flagellar hook protein FlgE n=1 Tax=Roseomonas sp. GC11 TaxID=2950546 RepID=UPI00210E0476|nr:flagellar hook-basal body complex protein [Roseomonas sp. GC11]MCQ4162289.1 flagellar hook-basal body complex protein [Roseomonas sp. GC11]
MSLLGSLYSATSGMGAQTQSITNISNNVANSSSTGYKRVETTFSEQLSQASTKLNGSSTVSASTSQTVSLGGDISQVDNALSLAISGDGLFAVSSPSGTDANGKTTYSATQYYTRAGDFSLDAENHLVNSSGYALEGWSAKDDGTIDQTELDIITVDKGAYAATATSTIDLSASVPGTASVGDAYSSQVQVYDADGNTEAVTLTWTKTSTANQWTLALDDGSGTTSEATVTFDGNGTISKINTTTGTKGNDATATLGTYTIDLGSYLESSGVTQSSASDTYSVSSITTDGNAAGAYSGVSIGDDGSVIVSYDNGKTKTIAQVPIVTFPNADGLQAEDGQAYTQTLASGTPTVSEAGELGAGTLVTSAVEASNVDITDEFSKMIIAQRAYTANTRVLSTVSDMLSDTIDILR